MLSWAETPDYEMKQSRPQSLRAVLTLTIELESYRLTSRQREFQVRGMDCATAIVRSTDEPGHGKSQMDDDDEVVSSQSF